MQIVNPNPGHGQGGTGFNPPTGGGTSAGALTPQFVTSTGGLTGTSGLLMAGCFNPNTGNPFITVFSPNNWDTEEDAEYDFRQESTYGELPGEGRVATIHRIVLKYRELGNAKYFINVTVYRRATDDFYTQQMPVNVPNLNIVYSKARKATFPDKRIHTIILHPNPVISGERPQLSTTRLANSGPLAITKIVMCGNADETSDQ